MVLKADPVIRAVEEARSRHLPGVRTVYLTPQGRPLDQALLAILPTRFATLRIHGLASKILIIDDVADTGETLRMVRDFCAEHVAETRTAVLYEKPKSVVHCDYVWKRTSEWISFPWSSEPPLLGEATDN